MSVQKNAATVVVGHAKRSVKTVPNPYNYDAKSNILEKLH